MIGVANPFTRHPVQVARAAATLDDHSPGRVALGYGAGNRRELILPLGGEQERAAAHCREALVLCRRLLRGEYLNHRGDCFVADGVELEMAPHPDVPLYLAARGPLVLQVAANWPIARSSAPCWMKRRWPGRWGRWQQGRRGAAAASTTSAA